MPHNVTKAVTLATTEVLSTEQAEVVETVVHGAVVTAEVEVMTQSYRVS